MSVEVGGAPNWGPNGGLNGEPLTMASLTAALRSIGVREGQTVLVHTKMSALGWVYGSAQAVVEALLAVVGRDGTLAMPAHSTWNTDPSRWRNPPAPELWWPAIRTQMPAFDPQRSPTRAMGVVAELFRTWPGVLRSVHPVGSFAARGPDASQITAEHPLDDMFGEASPLGRLYELDAWILLLGVGHENNTSLHLAEARVGEAAGPWIDEGSSVYADGERTWVRYRIRRGTTDDFPSLGQEYETIHRIERFAVGAARTRLLRMRPLVDFAIDWLGRNRA